MKHAGVTDYNVNIGSYTAIFDERTNIVTITKPILNEEFTFRVLVSKNDEYKDYTLCTFAENNKKVEDRKGGIKVNLKKNFRFMKKDDETGRGAG